MAQLLPLPQRPHFISWDELVAIQADLGLYEELREMLPETTDDIEDPWERAQRRSR